MKKHIRTVIRTALPHILFLLLLVEIFLLPGQRGTENYWVFVIVIAYFEVRLLFDWKNKTRQRLTSVILGALFIWETATGIIGTDNPMLYPPPEKVFDVYRTDYPKIIEGILSSMRLLIVGYLFALLIGIFSGLIVGWVKPLREVVMPIVKVLSPIPPNTYTPYAVALLPSFQAAQQLVVFLAIFWGVFQNVVLTVAGIDQKLLDTARAMNMKNSTFLFRILLPYCTPAILQSLSVSVSGTFMVLVAAEMLGATSGLGWFIKYYSDFADYARVIAGIIMVGIVITLVNQLLSLLQRVLVKWKV